MSSALVHLAEEFALWIFSVFYTDSAGSHTVYLQHRPLQLGQLLIKCLTQIHPSVIESPPTPHTPMLSTSVTHQTLAK